MASDTSNLFSKAEVREIKRFTKGNITFKHYTFIMTIFQLYLQLPKTGQIQKRFILFKIASEQHSLKK